MTKPLIPPLDPEEAAEKLQASRLRFRQSIFQTAGGAMLFALFGVITSKLLALGSTAAVSASGAQAVVATAATASASFSLLPVLGIVAVAALGLGCVYAAAHYLSDINWIEQESQARKFQKAKTKGVSIPVAEISQKPTLAPILDTPSSVSDHAVEAAENVKAAPALTIQADGAQWMDKIQAGPRLENARA